MAVFYYKIRDKNGEISEGDIEADSQEEVAKFLLERRLVVIKISKKVASLPAFLLHYLALFSRVPTKEMVIFFRQLSIMIDSDLPLVKALNVLARQTTNKRLQLVISQLAVEVEVGSSLSAAMELYSDVFDTFYVNIVRSGETSGRLGEVLIYLANQKEKDYELEGRVKGAMIYPALIFCVLIVVTVVVLTYVIPSISSLLKESGASLPLITRLLIGLSDFVRVYIYLLAIMAVIAVSFWLSYIKTASGRRFYDGLKLKIPIFGSIFRNTYLVRLCLSFATLIKGGVPIVVALGVVKDAVGNAVFEEIITKAIAEIDEGSQVSDAFADYEEIPSIVVQMIKVGEESGKLDTVLTNAAAFYTKEIETAAANLSTLLEPLIMIVMGIAVGTFVIAIYVPIWQMASSFGG